MKPTTYIDWGGLKDIPFFYCDTKEDEGNKDFDIYYQGKLVLHDYNHCGHYLYTATLLFSKIRNITADWVNLHNLWILRCFLHITSAKPFFFCQHIRHISGIYI